MKAMKMDIQQNDSTIPSETRKIKGKWKHHFLNFTLTSIKDFKTQLKRGNIHKVKPRAVTITPAHSINSWRPSPIDDDKFNTEIENERIFRRYVWRWKKINRYYYRLYNPLSDYYIYDEMYMNEDGDGDEVLRMNPSLIYKHLKMLTNLKRLDADIQYVDSDSKGLGILNVISNNLQKLEFINIKIPRHDQGAQIFSQIDKSTQDLKLLKQLFLDYIDFRCWFQNVPRLPMMLRRIKKMTHLRLLFADNFDAPGYLVNDETFSQLVNGLANFHGLKYLEFFLDASIPELDDSALTSTGESLMNMRQLEMLNLTLRWNFSEDAIKEFCEKISENKTIQTMKFQLDFGQYGYSQEHLENIFVGLKNTKNIALNVDGVENVPKEKILGIINLLSAKDKLISLDFNLQKAEIDEEILEKLREMIFSLKNLRKLKIGFENCSGVSEASIKQFRANLNDLKGISVNPFMPRPRQ